MAECIFCKIAKGEVPSEKFYEDKDFFAFLDIHPKSKGHAILTPKVHFENIFDAKENELLKLGEALKKVLPNTDTNTKIREALKTLGNK